MKNEKSKYRWDCAIWTSLERVSFDFGTWISGLLSAFLFFFFSSVFGSTSHNFRWEKNCFHWTTSQYAAREKTHYATSGYVLLRVQRCGLESHSPVWPKRSRTTNWGGLYNEQRTSSRVSEQTNLRPAPPEQLDARSVIQALAHAHKHTNERVQERCFSQRWRHLGTFSHHTLQLSESHGKTP